MWNVNPWKTATISFGVLCFCFTSCIEEEPPVITSAMHVRIDSLYKKNRKTRKMELDSLCDRRFQEQLQPMIDSILGERLEERRKRLGY